jgi:hypothetical protein
MTPVQDRSLSSENRIKCHATQQMTRQITPLQDRSLSSEHRTRTSCYSTDDKTDHTTAGQVSLFRAQNTYFILLNRWLDRSHHCRIDISLQSIEHKLHTTQQMTRQITPLQNRSLSSDHRTQTSYYSRDDQTDDTTAGQISFFRSQNTNFILLKRLLNRWHHCRTDLSLSLQITEHKLHTTQEMTKQMTPLQDRSLSSDHRTQTSYYSRDD